MSPSPSSHEVAYFSMEIALEPSMPTYAGGLGVLAGDTLRSAADLGVPMVGVTLVHRKGYFAQRLDGLGNQSESPSDWKPEDHLELMKPIVTLRIGQRDVHVRAWRWVIEGINEDVVPVYLLDTSLPENHPDDQRLTDYLYGGDSQYRLCQETVLGIGGVMLLPRLGHSHVWSYHMNEGHASLLTLGLLEQLLAGRSLRSATEEDSHAVRHKCIFTTHTPVPAGQDKFPIDLVRRILGDDRATALERTKGYADGTLNMTYLALSASRYINGVAMKHGEVSRGMFPDYPIRAITNGVHAVTWTTEPFAKLYDRHIPEWRRDNLYLRYSIGIPLQEIHEAHAAAKRRLLETVQKQAGKSLSPTAFTIGFARRAATYKRADLIFTDPERLKSIASRVGPIQFVFGGKAHPRDEGGKAVIRDICEAARLLEGSITVVYLEDFDWNVAPILYSGVDLWLNTPKRPQEASGTSGMKAALNGVPSLSVLDGWWIEGCLEGVTGWAIGQSEEMAASEAAEAIEIYDKLEHVILPMFYGRASAFAEVMRSAIALNGSFFNTQRMVAQYVSNAYFQRAEE